MFLKQLPFLTPQMRVNILHNKLKVNKVSILIELYLALSR